MVPAMSSAKAAPRRHRARDGFAVLALAVVVSVGCGNTDERPPTWAFISTAIMEPSCATANCHSAIAMRASVDLSTRKAGYDSLTMRQFVITRDAITAAGGSDTDDERVERSAVIHLMRADGTLRMPPDAPLPEVDIQLVERWIAAGGAND
jgi:hypothetical protein